MGEHVEHIEVKQNHVGKGLLGRPRCRWQNIKMDLKGIRYEGVDLIHLVKNNKKSQAIANMILTTTSQDTSS